MEPLAYTYRADVIDFIHYGDIAVVDSKGKLIYSCGDPYREAFVRSSAKPIQILPAFMANAIDHFNITDREIAIMCSSHNGEPEHAKTILGILDKIGLQIDNLKCGDHYPMIPALELEMRKKGEPQSPIFHSCSGKHCGMLMTGLMYNEPLEEYYELEHPIQ